MKNWVKGAIIASAMTVASPALAAVQIATANLSATNFAASTFTYTFAAGDYSVSLVNGLYSAWAPASPSTGNWTDYYKYTINGVTSFFNPLNSRRYATAADAFAAYSAASPLSLNFLVPTTVTFGIADAQSSFGDNAGGVSLAISAVPETATWMMMLAGFGMMGFALRAAPRRNGTTAAA